MDSAAQVLELPAVALVKPKSLLTPRRLDLAVKWRFFRHIIVQPGDWDSERVYRWHIEQRRETNRRLGIGMDAGKTMPDDYVDGAFALAINMAAKGFDKAHPIPIDPNGVLLGGAHRLACALALGIDCYVTMLPHMAWAPTWDLAWFKVWGMSESDMTRLLQDWNTICGL